MSAELAQQLLARLRVGGSGSGSGLVAALLAELAPGGVVSRDSFDAFVCV